MASQNPKHVDVRGGSINNVRGDQFNINPNNPASLDLNQLLLPVDDAAFSRSGRVARCHHGTRKELIARIVQWVEGSGCPVCWVNGPAGSGKSAVSQTIAEWCDTKSRLAASFFFMRGAGNRSTIARFVTTLAYQLSVSVPTTKPLIHHTIQSEPSIARRSLRHQFKKLMIEPIQAARSRFLTAITVQKPMVIVIDALDECDDKELMAEFIEVITDACRDRRLPFRVFFTSRVEEHLRKKLETTEARPVIYPLRLPDFDAHDDIRTFLQSRFAAIYEENRRLMRNVPLPWPSNADLEALVDKAAGSFIFAFTLINFIDDGSDFPHRKLSTALRAHTGLDTLYIQVFSAAPHRHKVNHVLGTIVLLSDCLSINSLAHLLELEIADILQALLGIQSIVMIPGDDDNPVQLFHESLREFLTTKTRSGNFFVDPPTYHIVITIGCLKVMAVPPEDEVYRDEVQQYACNNWCHHFYQGLTGGFKLINHPSFSSLIITLTAFESQSFDSWFNTLILCGQLPVVLEVLQLVVSLLEQSPHNSKYLLQIFEGIERHAKVRSRGI